MLGKCIWAKIPRSGHILRSSQLTSEHRWIRLLFSLKELAKMEGGARMERGLHTLLVDRLMLQICLHTYRSKKALFRKPSDRGQAAPAKQERTAFEVVLHLHNHLTVRCMKLRRPMWSVCAWAPRTYGDESVLSIVLAILRDVGTPTHSAPTTVSALVSVQSVLFHIKLKSDSASNLPGNRWSMKTKSVSKYIWIWSEWNRLHVIKREPMVSYFIFCFFFCKQQFSRMKKHCALQI